MKISTFVKSIMAMTLLYSAQSLAYCNGAGCNFPNAQVGPENNFQVYSTHTRQQQQKVESTAEVALSHCILQIENISTSGGIIIPLEAYALEIFEDILSAKNYEQNNTASADATISINMSAYTEFYHQYPSYNSNAIVCSAEIRYQDGSIDNIARILTSGSYSSLSQRCLEKVAAKIAQCENNSIDATTLRNQRAQRSRPHSRDMP